jgi:hypothetical protein
MRVLIHAVATIATIVLVSPASADFYTYAEWAALSEAGRSTYIAGLFDGMVTFVTPETRWAAAHYRQCLGNAKMNNSQLAENVRVYASTRPNLQQDVSGALINYVIQLCGKPPSAPER